MTLAEKLKDWRIVLGSGSPRRRELLAGLGIEFTVDSKTSFIENEAVDLPAEEVAEYMARGKSMGHAPLAENQLLITSDTVVILPDYEASGGIILGKPAGRQDAVRMLNMLSGRRHVVASGVCLRCNTKCVSFTAFSDVWFRELLPEEIDYYVAKFKPFDKAGSYGVQEWIGYAAISRIDGSFYNVMGLPVQRLYDELMKF